MNLRKRKELVMKPMPVIICFPLSGRICMERSLMKELEKWKALPGRKPLILWGARQVGKTWLMREFGKRYYPKTAYASFRFCVIMKPVLISGS